MWIWWFDEFFKIDKVSRQNRPSRSWSLRSYSNFRKIRRNQWKADALAKRLFCYSWRDKSNKKKLMWNLLKAKLLSLVSKVFDCFVVGVIVGEICWWERLSPGQPSERLASLLPEGVPFVPLYCGLKSRIFRLLWLIINWVLLSFFFLFLSFLSFLCFARNSLSYTSLTASAEIWIYVFSNHFLSLNFQF